MPKRDPTQIRKPARQQRSRETVDVILEAAAHILAAEGFEGATTNAIAQRAGVSIGSLYQYFPNKAALVRALNERHTHQVLELFQRRFADVGATPLAEAVRSLVAGFVEAHRVNPALHRVLVAEESRVNARTETRRVEAEVARLVRAFLEARRSELRDVAPELAAFLVVQALEAITHGAVLDRPDFLGEPLVDEATRLILGYLEPRSSG
jgi:AcrR family transcriptional regulator